MFRKTLKPSLTLLILILSIECSIASEPVTLFAASSLYKAMEEVLQEYRQQTQKKIVSAYASSSSLARQISQGAPADIFISANLKWMQYLQKQNMLEIGTHKHLLKNQLVLISHQYSVDHSVNSSQINKTPINSSLFKKLSKSERLAVGDPDHVPLGSYAHEALKYYNLWDQVQPFLAPTHNARSALNLVERQEAPLGISYLSDAKNSTQVKIIGEFSPQSHSDILYPVAIVKNRKTKDIGALYNFLFTETAADIFTRHGFSVVGHFR